MADKNNDGSLDFEEILKLLKQLNADMDKKYVQELFNVCCSIQYKRKNSVKGNNSFICMYRYFRISMLLLKVVDFVYFCFLVCRKLTRPKLVVNQYWMQRNLLNFITCWQKDQKLMKYSWNMMMEKDFGHLQICVNSSTMNKRYRNISFLSLVP